MPPAPVPEVVAPHDPLILALDSGSPLVSVAIGTRRGALAERSIELLRSSENLLAMVDDVLHGAGAQLEDLAGIVALRGPGSFTGLRVGLATVLGFHQATGRRATALPTLEVLAAAAPSAQGKVVGVVDALRGEWFWQPFLPPPGLESLAEPQRWPEDRLRDLAPCTLVGFGVERLRELPAWPENARLVEPRPLAPVAVRLAAREGQVWDSSTLTAPLYLRPPAVTRPKPSPP